MPLGISESTLRAAYGPQDLSGFYKNIDAFAKRAYDQEKAQKQALQKEYYTSLAVLNKDQNGMNPNDSNKFMGHFNAFKSAQQKLIANPNLIDRNPEEYGKLTAESNEAYGNATNLANASKLMQKKIKDMHDYAYKNQDKFEDGAIEKIASLTNYTTNDIIDNGLDDISKYVYQGPNLKDFNKGINDIYNNKQNLVSARINQYEDDQASVYNIYNIPSIDKVQSQVSNLVSTQKSPTKAANAMLDKFGAQVDEVENIYNNLTDEDFAKFKTPEGTDMFPIHHPYDDITIPQTRKPDLIFDENNPQIKLSSFLSARPIIAAIKSPQESGKGSVTDFKKGKIGEKEYAQKLAFELQSAMEKIRQRNRMINIRQGYIMKNDLVKLDRQEEAKFKMLLGLVGTQEKLNIKYGDELNDDKLNEISVLLDKVTGTVKKKTTQGKKKAY